MTIDLNFYPEQQTATLAALPKIVVDCDLTGWTFYGLVRCAYEAKLMLWDALNHVSNDGVIVPKWKARKR